MSKHRLIVLAVLLFLVPIAWPDDTVINIILTPRDLEDPTKADGYLCGIDSDLDSRRLIAELNPNFIFQQIDRTHDITPGYRTTVVDLVVFDKNNKPHRMFDQLPCSLEKEEPGLFTLFLAPGTKQCNRQTFEDAAEEKEGYYPLAVLVSSNFTEVTERFISEAQSFKTFFNGKHPKLCASGMVMRNETAHSRRNELTSIFNFAFMERRNFEATLWKSCQTFDDTLNSIAKSTLFDLNADLSFKYQNQSVKEADGFAKIIILRKSSLNQKALIFATTDFPANGGSCTPASENDIVPLSNLIVFNYGDAESEVIVRLKQDDEIEEAECFVVNIKKVTEMQKHRRRKRGRGGKQPNNQKNKKNKSGATEIDVTIQKESDEVKGDQEIQLFRQSMEEWERDERDCREKEECDGTGYPHCWIIKPNPGICVSCIEEVHCSEDVSEYSKCSPEKECVECIGDDDCQSKKTYCNKDMCDVCTDDKCAEEPYTTTPLCKNKLGCVECMKDADCSEGFICKGKEDPKKETKCVECFDDSNCESIFAPKCNNEGKCQPCTEDAECSKPDLQHCWTQNIDSFCAECNEDSNCKGLKCIHGKCRGNEIPYTLKFIDETENWIHRHSTSPVTFYTLSNKPDFIERCPLDKSSEDKVHTFDNTLPKSESDKLTLCALRILELLLSKYEVDKTIGVFHRQCIAIAEVREVGQKGDPELYIAGNLDATLLKPLKPDVKSKIIDNILHILDYQEVPYRKVFAINPDLQTAGEDNGVSQSKNHAEMQIISFINTFNLGKSALKKKEIISFHITKPPCCACNSVMDKTLNTKHWKGTADPPYTGNVAHAYSASNSNKETCTVNGKQELCGSQFHVKSNFGGDFGVYWNHPKEIPGKIAVSIEQLWGPKD